MRLLLSIVLALLMSPALAGNYQASTTVEETRERIAALPTDDIWWSVNGEAMRWNNLNLHKFEPMVVVHRDGPVRELKNRPNPAIGTFEVDTPEGEMAFQTFLDSEASTTMSVLVLHRGDIVFETYPRQQPHDRPLFWSVTKALVSTVLAILEDRGAVNVEKPVDHYIPRLKRSVYEGVRIRDVLDMASGNNCPDSYENWEDCYYRYSSSIGEGFRPPGSPDNPYDFIAGLPPDNRFAEPGTGYSYSGVDTFVIGWLVEEITGMPFQDALSKEVWTQMGAESDALIWAGRYGIPLTSGGLMARPRDVARFGLLFTPSWNTVTERPLISERYLDIILNGARPDIRQHSIYGDIRQEGEKGNVYQWDMVWENGDFMKGGWAGQGLMINPHKDLVAVWTGYFDEQGQEISILPMLRSIFAGVYPESDHE